MKKVSLVIAILISIMGIVVMFVYQNIKYTNITNEYISQIIYEIKLKYPEVEETEIVKILSGEKENASNILLNYGYDGQMNYILEIEQERNGVIVASILLGLGICVIWIVILYKEKMIRRKTVKELTSYFNDLNNRNYRLNIDENKEDDYTKLRNEIYKATILLKEVAEKSEQEKVELKDTLADISHQIKTPITSIKIMLDNILDNPNMDKELKQEFIKDISKQVDWISDLSISLLKLAKIDANAIKLNKQEVNVYEFINNIVKTLEPIIEAKKVDVVVAIDEKVVVEIDYKWQFEAIGNIIKNAVEHSKINSKIWIEAENNDIYLKLKIKDEAGGIAEKHLKYLFDRFYKVDNKNENSIGIGLAISKSLIEREDGSISVKSENGVGTEFEIKYFKLT